MAVTAIVLGAGAVAGATIYQSNQQEKAADRQLQQAEQTRRAAEEDMRKLNGTEAQTAARQKQEQARKQALAAYGKSDTLLTGPSGLGGMADPTKPSTASTLLGG